MQMLGQRPLVDSCPWVDPVLHEFVKCRGRTNFKPLTPVPWVVLRYFFAYTGPQGHYWSRIHSTVPFPHRPFPTAADRCRPFQQCFFTYYHAVDDIGVSDSVVLGYISVCRHGHWSVSPRGSWLHISTPSKTLELPTAWFSVTY